MTHGLSHEKSRNLGEAPWRSVGRRGALRRLGSVALAAASAVRFGFAQRRLALGLDRVEKLKAAGGAAMLKIEGRELLFIRDSEESVRVVNPICSHQKCTVEYNREKQRIVCPCHGSNYSLDGRVLNGPAERPLQVFEAALDTDRKRIVFSVE